MNSRTYRGFTITPRTFQIRGSGRWTLDLVITRRRRRRAFSGPTTFQSEQAAERGCYAYGRRIVDGLVPDYSLEDFA